MVLMMVINIVLCSGRASASFWRFGTTLTSVLPDTLSRFTILLFFVGQSFIGKFSFGHWACLAITLIMNWKCHDYVDWYVVTLKRYLIVFSWCAQWSWNGNYYKNWIHVSYSAIDASSPPQLYQQKCFIAGGGQRQVPRGSGAVHPCNLPGRPGKDEDAHHAPPLHRQDDLQRLHLLQQLRPHLLPPGQDHQPDHHQLQEVESHWRKEWSLFYTRYITAGGRVTIWNQER